MLYEEKRSTDLLRESPRERTARFMLWGMTIIALMLVVLCGTLGVVAYNSINAAEIAAGYQESTQRLQCKTLHYVNAPLEKPCTNYDFSNVPKITDPK